MSPTEMRLELTHDEIKVAIMALKESMSIQGDLLEDVSDGAESPDFSIWGAYRAYMDIVHTYNKFVTFDNAVREAEGSES